MRTAKHTVQCSKCGRIYHIPDKLVGHRGKCHRCGKVFRMKDVEAPSDTEILHWLEEHHEADSLMQPRQQAGSSSQSTGSGGTATLDRDGPLRVHTVQNDWVNFTFPVMLLEQEDFRSSLPRVCAGCLKEKHLTVHLVHWPTKTEEPEPTGQFSPRPRSVGRLSQWPRTESKDLLKYLPVQDHLPHPFNLPFPYYVCDRCNPETVVRTLTSVDDESGEESCWLRLTNLDLARQFIEQNSVEDSEAYRQLCSRGAAVQVGRWEKLSPSLQQHISSWFKPMDREVFLDYLPDEQGRGKDHSRSGVVVTDHRLVCHQGRTWKDFPLTSAVRITNEIVSGGRHVEVYSPIHGRVSVRFSDHSWGRMKSSLAHTQVRLIT